MITQSQWLEWIEYVKIRGPLGPAREDHYVAYLAMKIAEVNPRLKESKFVDYIAPWLRPDEVDPMWYVRPWIDTRGSD